MTELTVEKAAVAEDEVGLIAPTYPLPRLELAKGRGARVWDKDGVERLDFVSGIAVNAFGHAPRGLVRAIANQAKELGHVSNLYANRPAIELAKALTRATGYEQVFFANSGTEGIEAALKFCRARASDGGAVSRCAVSMGRNVAEDGLRLLGIRAVRVRQARHAPPAHVARASVVRPAASCCLVGAPTRRPGHVRRARAAHQPRGDLRRASPDHSRHEQRRERTLRRAGYEAREVVHAASRCRSAGLATWGIARKRPSRAAIA